MTSSLAGVLWAAAPLAAAGSASAQALTRAPDLNVPVYAAAHVDVTAEHTAQALAATRTYVEAARREPGAVRLEAVEELEAEAL